MLRAIAVDHYRSLRRLRLPLGQLNVITGPNGSGKSNVYRALRLLAECGRDGIGPALAREGGLNSALWAGDPYRDKKDTPLRLRLGYGGDDFGYAVDLGLPNPIGSIFDYDPEFKVEAIWGGPLFRSSAVLMERRGPIARVKDGRSWSVIHDQLRLFESVLGEIADFENAPEVIRVREEMRSWRFYDQFRTDVGAPARFARPGTRTTVLDNDGAALAAAWQTIIEIGDARSLVDAVGEAFPGSHVTISAKDGVFGLRFRQAGLNRPLTAAELSDGTLRFLMLAAALLSPRPPTMLVLNEPETSLHPDLIPALGGLINRAAESAQIVVVTHSQRLIEQLANDDLNVIELYRDDEGTKVSGQGSLDEPAWNFPDR